MTRLNSCKLIDGHRRVLLCGIILILSGAGLQRTVHAQDTGEFNYYFTVKAYNANQPFREPSALAIDEHNNLLYVADTGNGAIEAFSRQGVAKFLYGEKQQLKAPVGLAVDSHGDLVVAEEDDSALHIIDKQGRDELLNIPVSDGYPAARPGRMTCDRDGNLYVVERESCRIFVFGIDRNLKFQFGGIGEKRGQFKMLQDIATDRQGRIYALDASGTFPVQVFDRKGEFLYGFGNREPGDDGLAFPAGLCIDQNDQLWIVDRGLHLLRVFDRVGMLLRSFGSYGQEDGHFFHPVDIVIDALGRVWVLETGSSRMQVFSLTRPFEPFRPLR